MNLIDQFLYELDGASVVRHDEATVQLDALLAEASKLTPTARMTLQSQVTHLKQEALADAEVRRAVHLDLLERHATWVQRAAEATGAFAKQAASRVGFLKIDIDAVAAEISEYEATASRLDEVYRLLERAGQP